MSVADFAPRQLASASADALTDVRVLALLNGEELFGHERGNIEVFKTLRSAGATVRVGVNEKNGGGAVKATLEQLGFETFLVPFGCQWSKAFFRKRPMLLPWCLMRVARCSALLLREIRRNRPTHIHLGNPLAYSYVAPALGWSRVPLVYRAGDAPPSDSPPNLRIWKSCMRRSQRVVANSDFVRRSLLQALPDIAGKTVRIYNRPPEPSATGLSLPGGDCGRRVLYVGQISEHKGVRVLVDAARDLAPRYPDVTFDLVGGSIYTQSFEQTLRAELRAAGLERRIVLHGPVANPRPFFERASLHVAPSLFEEPAANVVLEAKAAGVPSVVFPSGGLPELVTDGVTGLVCRDKSVAALVEGIADFLDCPEKLAAARAAARMELKSRFSTERFRSEWVDVYLQTCQR
jgi:glycosyltransferase involved in cell wall biosynthesis